MVKGKKGFQKGHKINLGKKFSKEHKNKLSESAKGKHKYWKGKHFSQEHKKKMSDVRKNIPKSKKWVKEHSIIMRDKFIGKKSHFWKGGITPIHLKIRNSSEYKLWRKAVFERDNYTCIWCGNKEKIQADHIKPFALFPELRFAIDNGRTLCIDCHRKTNTYAGRVN